METADNGTGRLNKREIVDFASTIIGLAYAYGGLSEENELNALGSFKKIPDLFASLEELIENHHISELELAFRKSVVLAVVPLSRIYMQVKKMKKGGADYTRKEIQNLIQQKVVPIFNQFEGTVFAVSEQRRSSLCLTREDLIKKSKNMKAIAQVELGNLITGKLKARRMRQLAKKGTHGIVIHPRAQILTDGRTEEDSDDKPYDFHVLNWTLQELFGVSLLDSERALRVLGMDYHRSPNVDFREKKEI